MRSCPSMKQLLTPRQREMAALVAEGLSNHEIAERLFVTEHAVRQGLHRAYVEMDYPKEASTKRVMLAVDYWRETHGS